MSDVKTRRKVISAAAERDALLLFLMRQAREKHQEPSDLIAAIVDHLDDPGIEPTAIEDRWLSVLRGTLQAVLASSE